MFVQNVIPNFATTGERDIQLPYKKTGSVIGNKN
jgi:hypothetical protein